MIHGKGDGMKLTFGSMKQIRQRYERVLGYRELQKKAIDDRAFLMRRRKNVREVFVASMVLVMFLVPVTLIGNYWGVFQISCLEMVGWITALILAMGSSMYGATIIIREQWEKLYQPFYLGFWGVVFGGLTYLACRTGITAVSLFLFLLEILILGGVPRLTVKERILAVMTLGATGTIIGWRQHLVWQDIGCMASWGGLGLALAKARYDSYMRDCRQRRELKSALLDAETDPMTKLLNRRGLERSLVTTIAHCVRDEKPIAVLMIDIDNFKRYNDTFGHLEGDECIKKVAGEIHRATRRKTDLSARIGGEEFFVFLTGISEEAAICWALHLQESIEKLGIRQSPDNFTKEVTVSIGIQCGQLQWGEESIAHMREQADKELYNAKSEGRACVSINGTCYRSEKMEEEFGRKWREIAKRA